MPGCEKIQNFTVYQIAIHGSLDTGWSNWFNWLELSYQEAQHCTTLTGAISDQAELRGILNKLWDLNKSIISVFQLQDRI